MKYNTKHSSTVRSEIPKCALGFVLNVQYLTLEENSSDVIWTLAYSTASIYSRMSLTGNKRLPEITVIGSLNASEKPFKFCLLHRDAPQTNMNSHTETLAYRQHHQLLSTVWIMIKYRWKKQQIYTSEHKQKLRVTSAQEAVSVFIHLNQ